MRDRFRPRAIRSPAAVRIAADLAEDRLTLPREVDMLHVVAEPHTPEALAAETPAPETPGP